MIGKEPVKRYNVSLPPEVAERLRKIGGGNLSEGIRRCARLRVYPDDKRTAEY